MRISRQSPKFFYLLLPPLQMSRCKFVLSFQLTVFSIVFSIVFSCLNFLSVFQLPSPNDTNFSLLYLLSMSLPIFFAKVGGSRQDLFPPTFRTELWEQRARVGSKFTRLVLSLAFSHSARSRHTKNMCAGTGSLRPPVDRNPAPDAHSSLRQVDVTCVPWPNDTITGCGLSNFIKPTLSKKQMIRFGSGCRFKRLFFPDLRHIDVHHADLLSFLFPAKFNLSSFVR